MTINEAIETKSSGIMIDYVKIKIEDPDIPKIRNNPLLEWEQVTRERTGEIRKYTAVYYGLTFQVVDNKYLSLSGSLHKHWNSKRGKGEQNHNDFTYNDLVGIIHDLHKSFGFEPYDCTLENIEFGVNIRPSIPTKEILRSAIVHKNKPFTHEYTEGKYFRECERQRYILKIYDKALQYKRFENILRFENKTSKMTHIQDTGIKSLADLFEPGKLSLLGAILRADFNGILFYDHSILDSELDARERLILARGQTPAYWWNLLHSNPDLYYKKRNRFIELVRKYGKQNIQEIIGGLVTQKWNELLTAKPKTLQELTGVAKEEITGINHSGIGLKPVKIEFDQNYTGPWPVVSGKRPNGRYCLSCGKDISHQRPESKFCSAKYVGYQEAHRCRNTDSNPRDRIKKLLSRQNESLVLFDSRPFISKRYKYVVDIQL